MSDQDRRGGEPVGPASPGPASPGPASPGPASPGPASPAPTVAVTADRRRDEQALLLERHGLQVALYPLLQTLPADGGAGSRADQQVELLETTRRLAGQPPTYLVANTGFGMRTWFTSARHAGLLDELVAGLARHTTIVARGAKALGELRKVGLDAVYKAPEETMAEIAAYLRREDRPGPGVAGASVAVQLHGGPGGSLDELSGTGAQLLPVPVYTMGATGPGVAEALAGAIVAGELAAVTFTAAPQIHVLAAHCRGGGTWEAVTAEFDRGAVASACIGDVCAAAARQEGIASPLVPPHPRLASLASTVAAHLLGEG